MIMKRKTIIGSGIVLIGMLVSGLAASVAWFLAGDNTFKTDVNGSVVEEYFHCGSGTEEDPFVITRPMHYYHLVEFFQRKTELPVSNEHNVNFGTDYLYFQIGYDFDENSAHGPNLEVYDYDNDGTYAGTKSKVLNMAYFSGDNALMPIGTSECPFFGSFNGGATDDANAIKVQNLNIKSQENVIVEGGSSLTTRYTSDVGMFGYVADNGSGHDTTIHDLYIDGLSIDLTGAVAGKDAADAEGVSHSSEHDDKIYVGYIVGHMHTYTRYDSAGPTNSSPIYDVYINNATIKGGSSATCNFGYVGHADTINGVSGDDIDLTEIINDLAASSGGGGQGDDWGGSIDIRSLNQRIKAIMTGGDVSYYNTTTTNRYFAYHENNETKISLGRGERIDNYLKKDPDNLMVIYNLMGDGNHYYTSSNYGTLPGTAMPLLVNNDYSTASKNTGYIVSNTRAETSGSYSGKYKYNGSIRSASYYVSHIANSISDTALNRVNAYTDKAAGSTFEGRYDSSTAEILTNKSVNYSLTNFALIKDNYNKNHTVSNSYLTSYTKNDTTTPEALNLEKYNDSKATLNDVLTDAVYVHGIHFMGDNVLYNKTITLNKVILNGETYSNYSFPKSCIDFNLKEAGKINFFGGSYYNKSTSDGSYADCFFSLSVIERSGTSLVSNSIKKIAYIYKNTAYDKNDPDSPKYIYRYSDNSYSGSQSNVGDLVFDMRFITEQPPVDNAIYYFEIPVNKGEYALHGVSGHDAGGYLMYLDIAASGDEEEHDYNTDNMISNDTIFTQMEYTSSGYVINSCFNIAYVVPAGATKDTFAITVSRSGTVFSVEVVNTTINIFRLHVLLVDNDSDPDNDYPYSYTLKYNTGAVSTPYTSSGNYQGAESGTVLERLLT